MDRQKEELWREVCLDVPTLIERRRKIINQSKLFNVEVLNFKVKLLVSNQANNDKTRARHDGTHLQCQCLEDEMGRIKSSRPNSVSWAFKISLVYVRPG